MTLRQVLAKLHELMDGSIDDVSIAATEAQEIIYNFLTEYINNFEIKDGRFILGQDFTARFAYIQRKIEKILGDVYQPSIGEYLSKFSTVEEINIGLQKDFNQLVIDTELLSPTRKSIYNQAAYYLKDGLADAYIQPAKYLLMQGVNNGITIKQARSLLDRWNEGELGSGQLTSGRPTPRLQTYATQISRDSIYTYNGTINNVISEKYELNHFIYTGGLLKDSRPACVYFVGLKRKISLEEVPPVLVKYPQGVIKGTTKENFYIRRCGYNCQHLATPVRLRASDLTT